MPTYELVEIDPEADQHPLNRPSRGRLIRTALKRGARRPLDEHPLGVSIGLLVAAFLAWVTALLTIDVTAMTDLGLVSVLPVTAFVAIGLLAIGFAFSVTRFLERPMLWKGYVVAFIVLVHGTPPLVYGTLRYAWAWKHVGIVDYIQRLGSVDPNIGTLDVYHNWPGFFSLNAWLTEVAGLDSALTYASWAPLFFNLLLLGTLAMLFRALVTDERSVAIALWIYFLASWVGQDYFSPQALAYFLFLIVLAIFLKVLRVRPPIVKRYPSKVKGQARRALRRWRRAVASRVLEVDDTLPSVGGPGSMHWRRLRPSQRVGLLGLIVATMLVIASSHQLTPVMLTIDLLGLTGLGFVGPRLMPLLMFGLTVGWATTFAQPFIQSNIGDLSEIGAITANVDGTFGGLGRASAETVLVSWAARLLTLGIVIMAATAWLGEYRRGRAASALLALAALPVSLVIVSAYGDEVLFRIYLFALPFAALMIGVGFASLRHRFVSVAVLSMVLIPLFLLAFYGNDRLYFFTPSEVETVQAIYDSAPDGSLLIEGSRNYPTQFVNYENFEYVPIAREPWPTRVRVSENPVEVLGEWMGGGRHTAAYFLITRGQKAEVDLLGVMPSGSLERIEQELLESDLFTALIRNDDATVFVLTEDAGQIPAPSVGG